jgi:hypothetical protein
VVERLAGAERKREGERIPAPSEEA